MKERKLEPVSFIKEVTFYRCPFGCCCESQYKQNVEEHIFDEHTYPELEKKVKRFGNDAKFSSQEESEEFCIAYRQHLGRKKRMDEQYKVSIKWEGPGRYMEFWRDEEHGFYEAITEHIIEFRKVSY